MRRFEYRLECIGAKSEYFLELTLAPNTLNQIGYDGWELVSIFTNSINAYIAVFKREL